jgi:hypothetical protein
MVHRLHRTAAMNPIRLRLPLLVTVLFSVPFGLVACGNDAASHDAREATGTLSTALSTVGPDGATYRFVPGSELIIAAATWGAAFPIADSATTFQRRLGVGSYTLDLVFGQWNTTPALERTIDNVTEVVFPEWTDPTHPIAFTIVDGQITSVVLHFKVKGLGDITFATGQLQVTAEVTKETVSQATRLEQSASMTVSSVTYADPNAAYVTPLDLPVGSAHAQGVTLTTTGAWSLEQGDAVCAPVLVGGFSYSSEPLRRRLAHVLGGTGKACIHDGGAADTLKIVLSASGPVPADQQGFLPDADYFRDVIITGSIPDVFDGAVFQQSALESTVTLTGGTFQHRLYATTPSFQQLTRMVGQLDGSIKLRAD